ncbi:AAA family ATPase [Luteolibacter pohnpeiensis]|uniref:AAA family ATPase n=1 Tax=Luteolibacter pohnpeiensis TaxID=454153 RepID=A0A934SEG3_9BACT|nr:AAA family ATPase [Luteolibacter pohnpeiensis]MBK1883698.1 AAA family ATPase [Luteolibacter pohnpeiensis]
MKILQLEINDVKRISAVEINPTTGKPVILTGDNANGKSSVLDAIVLTLSNTGLDDPIRHGRPSGSVKITLGQDRAEYLVERKITKKGSYLSVVDAAGVQVPKAQTFLNGLLGNYAFDPLEFTKLKAKQQVEALKQAAGLDFTELDAKRAQAYATRTEVNREGVEVKARFEAMEAPAADVPNEEVSATTLVGNLQELRDKAMAVERAKEESERAKGQLNTAEAEVKRIKAELDAAKDRAATAAEKFVKSEHAVITATEQAPDADALRKAQDAVEAVDKTNAAVRSARLYRETEARLKELCLRAGNLNREIEVVDEKKLDLVKNAAMPLDGLELTDEGVMFNGTFFNQLSTAEQIRISTLVAMAQNPKLRIVMIREGALMNTTNLEMISQLAEGSDYQLWIEKFQENPSSTGLHIVDGAIAFEDGQAVA